MVTGPPTIAATALAGEEIADSMGVAAVGKPSLRRQSGAHQSEERRPAHAERDPDEGGRPGYCFDQRVGNGAFYLEHHRGCSGANSLVDERGCISTSGIHTDCEHEVSRM